jgi:hypothetical protein
MTGQDGLDVARFLRSHGDADVQTGGRGEDDGAPPSANMCEMEPHVGFPPLAIVGIDASSIGIKYLQEHLIGEMMDRPVRRPLCVLPCEKSVGESRRVNRLTDCCSSVASMVLDVKT